MIRATSLLITRKQALRCHTCRGSKLSLGSENRRGKLVLLSGTRPGHRRVEALGLPVVALHEVFRAEELVFRATKTPDLMSIGEGEPALNDNPLVDSTTTTDHDAAAASGGSPKGCRAPTGSQVPSKGHQGGFRSSRQVGSASVSLVSNRRSAVRSLAYSSHYLSKKPDLHCAQAYQAAEAGCHHLGDAVHCENFGHDYGKTFVQHRGVSPKADPTPQQWLQIRQRAKRFPCYAFNDGKCMLQPLMRYPC